MGCPERLDVIWQNNAHIIIQYQRREMICLCFQGREVNVQVTGGSNSVIAALGGIEIDAWASKYHLVSERLQNSVKTQHAHFTFIFV